MKYRVTGVQEGNEEIVLQWVDVKNGVPLKTAAEDGSWSQEYRNAKIGTQPDALFEIPEGYRMLKMPPLPDGLMGPALSGEGEQEATQAEGDEQGDDN